MAIQDLCCLRSHSHKNSLCPQSSIFVIKIVDFICFIMCSKSSHWHAHIYIQQTHVYYDGYNKTMDNTRRKHDSNNYFKVHQCHCFCCLWFFLYFFWLMLVRLQRSNFIFDASIHKHADTVPSPLACHVISQPYFSLILLLICNFLFNLIENNTFLKITKSFH